MGNCLKSKHKNENEASTKSPDTKTDVEKPTEILGKKPKSWELRGKLNKEDYQYINRENEVLYKKPGQINGQQFIIEKCKNCKILLCDYNATVFVDDCENCQIFIGPCSSSVFVRTSSNISLIVACQQYRISESQNINTLLFCTTQPTLEKSSGLKFGCFNFSYFSLREQFDKATLNIWNNAWFEVFDFSKLDANNFSFYPKNTPPNTFINNIKNVDFEEIGVFWDIDELNKNCVVPRTSGTMGKNDEEEILFFIQGENQENMEQIISQMNVLEDANLIRTKAIKLNKSHLDTLFTNKSELNLEEILNSKREAIFLLFSGKKLQNAKDLISQTNKKGTFYHWDKKEQIKKFSALIFDTWKNENPILK